jgi:hypothetical protein
VVGRRLPAPLDRGLVSIPLSFWRQSPRTFVNAMEGAAKAEERRLDHAVVAAWYTATFALGMYSGKLKGKRLTDFLSGDRGKAERNPAADAVAFFHRMKAAGFPVKIERVVH